MEYETHVHTHTHTQTQCIGSVFSDQSIIHYEQTALHLPPCSKPANKEVGCVLHDEERKVKHSWKDPPKTHTNTHLDAAGKTQTDTENFFLLPRLTNVWAMEERKNKERLSANVVASREAPASLLLVPKHPVDSKPFLYCGTDLMLLLKVNEVRGQIDERGYRKANCIFRDDYISFRLLESERKQDFVARLTATGDPSCPHRPSSQQIF